MNGTRPSKRRRHRGIVRRMLGPVRVRAALGATGVVAVALVAAGLVLLLVVDADLARNDRLHAESRVRDIASQAATSRHTDRIELPDADEYPTQIVDGSGRVLAAGDGLKGRTTALSSIDRAEKPDDERSEDDRSDDDDRPGSISGTVKFATERLPVDDDGDATDDAHEARGTAEFRVAAERAVTPSGRPVTVYTAVSVAASRETVARTAQTLLIAVPGLLVVVGCVTWLVTGRALGPVEDIRAELAEITAGDLSRRVPVPPARDEVGRLARTTNATLAALDDAVEQQRRFVADASHELRSPIASLRTQIEVARAHPGTLDVEGLLTDTVRLQDLAADLLLLARLDAGDRPRDEPLDLAALVREELLHRVGDPHPIELDAAGAATVRGSRSQLCRVLANLVDNAQRHAASKVAVSLRPGPVTGGAVVLSVDDDGRGVAESDRERIFQRFIRLDDARSRDDGGAGLGLAIVGDVVRRHGGSIEVSRSPLGGARFTVELPADHPRIRTA